MMHYTTCRQRGCTFEPFGQADPACCPVCGNPLFDTVESIMPPEGATPPSLAADTLHPPEAPTTPVDGHEIMATPEETDPFFQPIQGALA